MMLSERSRMEKDKFVIGVLGGMGTYATIYFFRKYADIFKAAKEWERPRIIIDNRCTMPSRVRAYMYNENVDELVEEMSDSLQHLMQAGCNHIILACNTSHLFLPFIYDKCPKIKGVVLNIIDNCVQRIMDSHISNVYLLASEGTIDSGIYQNALREKGITCYIPNKNEYGILRECIEAVKQNVYSERIKNIFTDLLSRSEYYILGCTELPVLYEMYSEQVACKRVFDPMSLAIEQLKKEFDNE